MGGRREAQEGRDVCILIADSHCTAETNRTLYNYTPINFLKNGKTRTLNRSSQFQKVTSVYISSLPIAGNGRRGREKKARLGEWGSQSVPVPPAT